MCVSCHGAPGVDASEAGDGLNPPAPDLTLPRVQKRTDGELFWLVQNGIRMTGMPAFGTTHKDEEIWKIVAFVRRLPSFRRTTSGPYAPRAPPPRSTEDVAAEGPVRIDVRDRNAAAVVSAKMQARPPRLRRGEDGDALFVASLVLGNRARPSRRAQQLRLSARRGLRPRGRGRPEP